MTKEQQQVQEFMLCAEQEINPRPTKNIDMALCKLRAKLILEEALETIKALGVTPALKSCGYVDLEIENISFHGEEKINLVELADGLADLHYVAYCGTANLFGIDMEPIFQEVHKSNMSKFIDGYKRADGKWIKGPSYSPANLAPIILEQQTS